MPHTSMEHARRELIEVLLAEGNHFQNVAAALKQGAGPGNILSALEFFGETHLCGKINALGGSLGVLALLAQEQEQEPGRMQAKP
jgi:hypothetical protein